MFNCKMLNIRYSLNKNLSLVPRRYIELFGLQAPVLSY